MAKNIDNVVEIGSNTGDLKSFVERIENVQADIDAIAEAKKEEQAPLRDDMKELKREAADAGIARKELNSILAQRKDLKKAQARRSKLDEDQQATFDSYIGDLKDTPLGKFAFDMAAAA